MSNNTIKEKIKKISTPLSPEIASSLLSGDEVLISGVIYTARDAAHKRLVENIKENKPLPFDLKNAIIYYVGPTPERPGEVIGSAGPTTSYRMDPYSVQLMQLGLRGMIGKGERNSEVIEAMKKYSAVYFTTIGGAGALIRNSIVSSEMIAYEDLGAESVRKLVIKDFPAIVTIDTKGDSLYDTQPLKYKR